MSIVNIRSLGLRQRQPVAALTTFALSMLLLLGVAPAQERTLAPSFADLAARVAPSVVNISSERKGEAAPSQRFALPEGSPFSDFFRRFWDQLEPGQTAPRRALGSGFIIDQSGYIATNNHVVQKADEIIVTLNDGRQFKAKLVGADTTTDLALLKIEASELPAVSFGDSAATRVGDWVMAVGNPFNLGGTVTVGVLSARNRNIRSGPYDDFLQIDAPINPGNSGGPLFNTAGEVIGVNTAIYSSSGGNIGIGFAIPSSMASKVLSELREHGRVERGWLGVYIQPMTEDVAKALGLSAKRGALISQVQDDSPAEKAGIKAGDVILSVDGKDVKTSRNLAFMVAEMDPGQSVSLEVWRDGKRQTISVKLAAMQTRTEQQQPESGPGAEPSYGLALGEITELARGSFNIPMSVRGALVMRVMPGSVAAAQGVQAGDVIIAVGGQTVSDPAEAIAKLDTARKEGKPALLLISRGGVTRFVALKAGA